VGIEWIEPLMVAANWMPGLIEAAGGSPGITRQGARSAYTPWGDVCSFDPQVIVVMPCGFDLQRAVQESQALKQLPGWSRLSAVRQRRVHAVDGNAYFNRSGPRMVDSLEILAAIIHPDRFNAASHWTAARAMRVL
jgi:iron complex transport system substrate-binding protein